MNKNESEVLAEVYEKVRGLSKFYISRLKESELDKRLEIDGIKFNSAYWIVAHLVWTEHFLIVEGVGGKDMKIDWINEYSYGSEPDKIKSKPDYKTVLQTLDEVHEKAIEIIKGMSDEQLEEENYIDADFGGSKTRKNVIIHAIRHEPMHIGQLSWLVKTMGK